MILRIGNTRIDLGTEAQIVIETSADGVNPTGDWFGISLQSNVDQSAARATIGYWPDGERWIPLETARVPDGAPAIAARLLAEDEDSDGDTLIAGVVYGPDGLEAEPFCSWGTTDAQECAVIRERSAAGSSEHIPTCDIHPVNPEP